MTIHEARNVCVVLASLMSLAWLFVLFAGIWPSAIVNGDDLLLYAVLISVAMFFLGAVCFALALQLVVRYSFAAALSAAPLLHAAGSIMEGLWCLPFFIIPSVGVIYLGIRELCSELPGQQN